MTAIDLNADLGEGAPHDAELMAIVTSANVCCAGHAGSPELIRKTLELALQHQVTVGAHPGYPDREQFGRRELAWSPIQIRTELQYQLGGLDGIARAMGVRVRYVKPHGALYNQASRDLTIARAVCAAVYPWNLPLVGLPGSALQTAAEQLRLPFLAEGFADRRYRPDGSLVPRSEPNSLIESVQESIDQVKQLLRESTVRTICVHGDHPKALHFARELRSRLTDDGLTVQAWS